MNSVCHLPRWEVSGRPPHRPLRRRRWWSGQRQRAVLLIVSVLTCFPEAASVAAQNERTPVPSDSASTARQRPPRIAESPSRQPSTAGDPPTRAVLDGIVRTVTPEETVLRLATPTGITLVLAPWAVGQKAIPVGTNVRVRGAWITVTRADGGAVRALLVENPAQLQIVRAAPDESRIPLIRLADLVSSDAASPPAHRVKVRGTVTSHPGGTVLYVTDGSNQLRIRSTQVNQLAAGDVIEALGFVTTGTAAPALTDAVIRRISTAAPPQPRRVEALRLRDRSHEHALVAVQARVIRHGRDLNEYELLLSADGVEFEASLPLDKNVTRLEDLLDGSLVEVIGIADISSRGRGGSLSAEIRLRSADDVRVLASPPWWTPQRIGYLFVGVLLGMLGAGGWVVALRRRLPVVERARDESEQRYRQLFEQAPAGHFVSRADGTLTACNEAFARMLGFASAAEAVGSDCESLYVDTRDREQWLDLLRREQPVENRDVPLRARDGRIVTALETAVARFNQHGDIIEIQGFLIDRTEQRRAEASLRERDAQLLQSQKMEAIGRLAGGVAHDFNNLLTSIGGNADLARQTCADRPDTLECMDEILKAARSASGLTRQLLAFSRRHALEPTTFDLNLVITELHKMLQRLLGEDIQMTVKPAPEPLYIRADRAQLDQVLVNLAVNARDAMPHGGRLAIETATRGKDALLVVSDTGCGMDQDTMARIFEPFFTTKQPGHGTGLGLAMVYGTIAQIGGTVAVQSEPLCGATFRISLPRAADAPAQRSQPRPPLAANGSGTILLVDDNPGVASLTRRVLERAGYSVLTACEGSEALSIAQSHKGSLDLLLSDIVMPGMTGPELAQSLSNIRPRTRVLLMSGYADHAAVKGHVAAPAALIQKPFTQAILLDAVREALSTVNCAETRTTQSSAPPAN